MWSLRLIGKSALAQESDEGQVIFANFSFSFFLLAPTGALIVIMVYRISAAATAATFSDFQSVQKCN